MDRWDETYHRLLGWTNGQGPSERLAAQVLYAEGYRDIDPSHPLGGRDGGRDAMCTKNERLWIMAVYFPRGAQSFGDIKKKLIDDLATASEHNPDGLAFVTNQELRLGERDELEQLGGKVDVKLYHLNRLTSILDRPEMATVRQQFLQISSGQPPIAVDLALEGTARYFTDGPRVRESHLDRDAQEAREQAPKLSNPPSILGPTVWDYVPGFANETKRLSGDELEQHIERWKGAVRKGWAECEDHLAATAWPALSFKLTNKSQALLNDVQVIITISGVRGVDWLGPEHFDEDKALPPVFPTATPGHFSSGIDPAYWQTLRLKDYPVSWESKNDTVVITIDLEHLRPHPTWESPRSDVVLVLNNHALTEVTVEWTLTAQGYGEPYRGKATTLAAEAITMAEAAQAIASGNGED
ncbi:hypothetical protein ACFQZZ_14530 [Nocardia sp. GCM10030253]|uniref:hypothetical protein n=1 Tax=Nocardia sp. GCM10030253 TaxID=3273404 RepID=UPI00362D7C28